tara:strand:- start:3396 stop:3506 length:111 start_codon:yes stop_codon:yes gene_type:complete
MYTLTSPALPLTPLNPIYKGESDKLSPLRANQLDFD